jgi:hypothetical protein
MRKVTLTIEMEGREADGLADLLQDYVYGYLADDERFDATVTESEKVVKYEHECVNAPFTVTVTQETA